MSAQDWAKSRMYRRGYEDGRTQGRAEASHAVIRIHMADGKVLLCQDVIDELARAGWQLCPIARPPQLKLVENMKTDAIAIAIEDLSAQITALEREIAEPEQ